MATSRALFGRRERGIGDLFRASLLRWGLGGLGRFCSFVPPAFRMHLADARRRRTERRLGGPVPYVVAVSPTMRCNYRCAGCYSGGRSTDNELSAGELDTLFTECSEVGVLAILLTGGEPLLRADLTDLIERHRMLFFVLISNGSMLTGETVRRLKASGNTMTLVSIEGDRATTDARRGEGAHAKAIDALELLRERNALHGFAATVHADNAEHLASDAFIDEMTGLGCVTGYYTEYVPCDEEPRNDWLLDVEARNSFRERIVDLRRRKPIVLVQFPQDEYGSDNLCSAAGKCSLHIGPQGDVEPCPFVAVSCDSIRRGGLGAALRSPFLSAIRERPDLLRRDRLACALFEHRAELETLAEKHRTVSSSDRS